MMRAAAAVLFLAHASLAQLPPSPPCPSTPANYCACGEGDHSSKWLCRANNGYTWETNDDKPNNPCPCKYPACDLHKSKVGAAFFANIASERLALSCLHQVDTVDHKCFEACAAMPFKIKGIESTGRCPALYSSVDTTKKIEACSDGVTNLRYCPAAKQVNITIVTKGQVGPPPPPPPTVYCHYQEDTVYHKCFEACAKMPFKIKGIEHTGHCPSSYSTVDNTTALEACSDGVTNLRYCPEAKKVHITIETKGEKKQDAQVSMLQVSPNVELHIVQGNHCNDLTVDFTLDGTLDRVNEWYSANKYKYAEWKAGLCPAPFNTKDYSEHPIGVKGVTFRQMGEDNLSLLTPPSRLQ